MKAVENEVETKLEELSCLSRMRDFLATNGRQTVEHALLAWKAVDENATGQKTSLPDVFGTSRKFASQFVTVARSFLVLPASSASAERLFSDAGNLEGRKRHNITPKRMDMVLTIRKWLLDHFKENCDVVLDDDVGSLPSVTKRVSRARGKVDVCDLA